MQNSLRLTHSFERKVQDGFGVGARTITRRGHTLGMKGVDKYNTKTVVLSGGLSAQQIAIDPLGASVASLTLLYIIANPTIDIRLGSSTHTPISGIAHFFMTGVVSNLFVTTGSNETIIDITVGGGSNSVITASLPLP